MLPLVVQLTKEIGIPYIPPDVWGRIKEKVDFIKVTKGSTHRLEHTNIILIDGNIELPDRIAGPGHYKLSYSEVGKIYGPARYYQSDDAFTL